MPNRRRFLSTLGSSLVTTALGTRQALAEPASRPRSARRDDCPNVLFLSVDGINDWIGVYGGHPQAHTPNLDALAARSTVFTKAYCSVPLCYPSRIATMTGIRPHNSGVYDARTGWRDYIPHAAHLPDHFRAHGYTSIAGGKVYHHTRTFGPPGEAWAWDQQLPPPPPIHDPVRDGSINGYPVERSFDWGSPPGADEDYMDHKTVDWLLERLSQPSTRGRSPRPMFLAAGIYKPHLPWYAPKRFFDRFPPEDVVLPEIIEDDLVDVPAAGQRMVEAFSRTEHVSTNGLWDDAVAAYLAAISFADYQVGRLLDGLAASPFADNTIVVMWSDHGFHLGEKLHWDKHALWEEATRVPLMVHVPPGLDLPGSGAAGRFCDKTVELVDLFPTLTDLCGLPTPEQCDGRSLAPLLDDPDAPWDRPVIATWRYKNHTIRSDRYRYIRYRDGSEELYDHETDPLEWTNLAGDPTYDDVRAAMATHLPEHDAFDPVPVTIGDEPDDEAVRVSTYPNPSPGPVTVEVVLDAPSAVTVALYTVQGRHVRTLVDGRQLQAGPNKITWDGCADNGSLLPGGMYLCVVQTERTSETRRIVLLP